MYLTYGYSYALHGIGVDVARAWFSGESPDAEVADPDFTLTLPISTNPSLSLAIDTSHERSLNISRSVSMTLER